MTSRTCFTPGAVAFPYTLMTMTAATANRYAIPKGAVTLRPTPSDHLQAKYEEMIAIPRSHTTSLRFGSDTSPVRLRVPVLTLTVSDEDRDGIFVVTDSFSTVYGEGTTGEAAIEDYVVSLVELFQELEENFAVLAPGLKQEYDPISHVLAHAK